MLGQQLVNGIVMGGVYALFALGFTIIFGIHRILNLAHGAVFMVGAFIALYTVRAGWHILPAMLLGMIGAGLLSVFIEMTAFRPLRKLKLLDAEFGAMITSIGASLVIMAIAQYISATQVMRFPFGTIESGRFQGFGLRLTYLQLSILVCVGILLLGLMYYLYKTNYGRQVRALSSNPKAAQLLGVNPNFIFFQTFFASGMLAGAAGVMIGLSFNSIHFGMGEPYLLRAFVAIVLGGLGSIPGALVGSLALGITQALSQGYFTPQLSDLIIYGLLFVALVLRPNGIFGKHEAEGITRRI
jgi:branched-chain amino acid transport system permease protein